VVRTAAAATRFGLRQAGLWALGRWHRFGYACVNFGNPISMREWTRARGVDLRALPREERAARLQDLGAELMAAVGRVVPVLPVSLVATALLQEGGEQSVGTFELHARTQGLVRRLASRGAHVYVPRADEEYAVAVGLRMLVQRRLVEERGSGWAPVSGELPVLRYYANAVAQLL
jgi:glycerol-3-phosphate O-acyltransferase